MGGGYNFRGNVAGSVIDDTNYLSVMGNPGASGFKEIHAGGEVRLLSATPRPPGYNASGFSSPFSSKFQVFQRGDLRGKIEEQKAQRRRVSDFQQFKPHDQNGLPTCWANGPAHAMTTKRVMQGLPLRYISACSIAVPISGGHSGGYEGDATEMMMRDGACSVETWSNNDTNRSLIHDPKVAADRLHFKAMECLELNGFLEFATACLLGLPCGISYNWWSHVVMLCDLVEIENDSFGFVIRNNWGDWGEKNDFGFYGYKVMREGHGTPSGGWALNEVTPYALAI